MLTYLGTADDVVQRFPWSQRRHPLGFNQTLFKYALFGMPIAVNDGYIFQSSQAVSGLVNSKVYSPIEALAAAGFAKILTRTDNIEDMPEAMIGKVKSHESLARRKDFGKIKSAMRAWGGRLKTANAALAWPQKRRTSDVLYSLYQRFGEYEPSTLGCLSVAPADYRLICENFRQQYENKTPDELGCRTAWEGAISTVLGEPTKSSYAKTATQELMVLANESYHFCFAACLAYDYKVKIAVDTVLSSRFIGLVEPSDSSIGVPMRRKLVLPCPTIPRAIQHSDGRPLVDLVNPELARPIYVAKQEYLKALDRVLLSGEEDSEAVKALKEAARRYDSYIASHFGLDKRARSTAELSILGFDSAVGAMGLLPFGVLWSIGVWVLTAGLGVIQWKLGPRIMPQLVKIVKDMSCPIFVEQEIPTYRGYATVTEAVGAFPISDAGAAKLVEGRFTVA